jgi:predicted ATPase
MELESEMEWELSLKNWRGIKSLQWKPFGVSLLTGPNGSGKTSVLSALRFLKHAYTRDVATALSLEGNIPSLRHLDCDDNQTIEITLSLNSMAWKISLAVDGSGIHAYQGERFTDKEEVLFRRAILQRDWFDKHGKKRQIDEGTCLRIAHQIEPDERFSIFTDFVSQIAVYGVYSLEKIRHPKSAAIKGDILSSDGENLFSVLQNWKSASRSYEGRFEWVLRSLRMAFPDQIEDIEMEIVGGIVLASFYPPKQQKSLPLSAAADGVLTGLLHLTAVAGAKENSVIAIEEMENQLHPHAIRAITKAMRERAEEKNLTVLLTSHSPVLMNEYKGHEDQFFIIHPNQSKKPQALDEMEDPDWLAHFALGDLYANQKIASPLLGKTK